MCARDEGEMTISPLLESARAFVERRERKVSFLAGRGATFVETIDWGGGIYYAVLCGGSGEAITIHLGCGKCTAHCAECRHDIDDDECHQYLQ